MNGENNMPAKLTWK